MPEVANPAVIIGLGGTGKWVLTYIKKNLLDTYGGEIPKTIQLLSFDTTTERGSDDGVAQEEDVRVGNIQLESESEFVYLGGNIYRLCQEISKERQYPHIGSWLQADTYLQTLDTSAFDISKGAGQRRPFGRMAIFYDLQSSMQAKITNKIQSAITKVSGANQRSTVIEIYIVASIAGGTGSGMFIDMAHLARWFAHQHLGDDGFAVRGFLAMHNTFNSVIKTAQIQPQAFAALRELDRFMLVFDQKYPIVYNPNNPELNTIYSKKLFDNCYLLDASRENLPLDGVPPQNGVFPSIADCITMMLDARTGDTFGQHYKNVNDRIRAEQSENNQPMYSSLGTYSLILPVEDIITSLTYRFAMDLLGEYLLSLEQRTSDAGQVQYILRYEGNAREEAATLLRSTQTVSGITNTNFIQRVPATLDSRNPRDAAYINETATLEAVELLTWIIPPETDPSVQELAHKVRTELEMLLINEAQPSDIAGDESLEGCDRIIREVRTFRETYLGRDVGGRRTGGLYRQALEKCVEIHRERYNILLQEYLLNLLNGPAPMNRDYQQAKQGKLGQAQYVLYHLGLYLNDLTEFIDRIKNRRKALDELRNAQEDAALCRAVMEAKKGDKGFPGVFLKNMQPGIKAQRAYLDAEQWAIDVEIKDLFFDFIQHASDTLRQITEEYKAAVDIWINTLAQGFTGNFTDPGLYNYLHAGLKRHTSSREEKLRIRVHEYVTNDAYESELYASMTSGKFAEAMTQFVWGEEKQSQGFQLSLNGCAIGNNRSVGGRSATERNAEFFLGIARKYFEPLRGKLTISDRLAEWDAKNLARKMLDKCSPMIRYDPLKTGGAQEFHNFVCADEGNHQAFFNAFEEALRNQAASAKDNQVLNSSNPYTCTVLSTADVFTSSGLLAYTTAERKYNNHTGDARLLHLFPAEVNAVQLEQHLPDIREPRRRFSHKLTTMLEDRKMVEHFILATLYRFIRLEKAEGMQSRWVLFLPTQRRRGTHSYTLTYDEHNPSLFEAMETFVFHRADISNPAQKIDFTQLVEELRRFEEQASEGNDSRLINLLEDLINTDIEPRRQDPNQAIHDLGSLMRLVVDEIVEGLSNRLKASGQHYESDARPLKTSALPTDSKPTVPREMGNGTTDGAGGSPPVEPISVAAPVSEIDKPAVPTDGNTDTEMAALDKLKTMLDRGLISQEKYDAKVQEILDRM